MKYTDTGKTLRQLHKIKNFQDSIATKKGSQIFLWLSCNHRAGLASSDRNMKTNDANAPQSSNILQINLDDNWSRQGSWYCHGDVITQLMTSRSSVSTSTFQLVGSATTRESGTSAVSSARICLCCEFWLEHDVTPRNNKLPPFFSSSTDPSSFVTCYQGNTTQQSASGDEI